MESSLSTTTTWHLQCPVCGTTYNNGTLQTFATCCNQPLITDLDLSPSPKSIIRNTHSMWRYRSLLPVNEIKNIVSLGEGWTPLHSFCTISTELEIQLIVKDEGVNPTGSFKARGISAAVSKLKELGVQACMIPTAGNAGGALSAYCAKAGIKATVVMPDHTPALLQQECRQYGATLMLVNGLIDSCGKLGKEITTTKPDVFDMSTLKEPYRLEGKKTMGYEIAEQLNWQLPDVIIYPTGGGTGLIGIWKAFKEMQQLGWIGNKLPRMVAVQTRNCNPVWQYWNNGKLLDSFKPVPSIAHGLAVPYPFAIKQILQVLQESNGIATQIYEHNIPTAISHVASKEGLLFCPEGAACYLALKQLRNVNSIKHGEKVLLLNTGSWYKYH
jgi:threonine synthase